MMTSKRPCLSRSPALLAAATALLVTAAAAPAAAQTPPPDDQTPPPPAAPQVPVAPRAPRPAPPAYAPPGQAQPGPEAGPPGYAPPGYAPPGYAPPGYAPPGYAPGYAPPGYGAPPPAYSPGYAPPGYGAPPPYYAQAPAYGAPLYYGSPSGPQYPSPPRERRSTGGMVAGIIISGLGLISLGSGAVIWSNGVNSCAYGTCNEYPYGNSNQGDQGTGVAFMVGGLVGLGVGIPLIVWGARKVPVGPQAAPQVEASVVPSLRVGPKSVQLGWHF